MEKVVNVEAKAYLQPLLETREINFKYPKNNRPTKKDKNKVNCKY